MAHENSVTYADVEQAVAYIKERWGRSTTYRLDPDYMKVSDRTYVRYWVVAEVWGLQSKGEHAVRAGAWFRGKTGYRTMPEAMLQAVLSAQATLAAAEDVAKGQAAF